MISSFAADIAMSTLFELTWRSAAIVFGTWALLRAWPTVSAHDRRRVWIVAHLSALMVAAQSSILAARTVVNGAPTSRTVLIKSGAQSNRIVIPVNGKQASTLSLFVIVVAVAGSVASAIRLVGRERRMRHIVQTSASAGGADLRAVELASRRAGLRNVPQVRLSDALYTAAVCGMRRPTVLLGRSCTSWSNERREHVIAHEVQHIASRDLACSRLSDVVAAFQWWNPAVHFASRALAAAQEMACDARVVAGGISSASYAETLLDLTRALPHNRYATELGVGGASLVNRISALLDDRLVASRTNARALLASAIALSATVLIVPANSVLHRISETQIVDMDRLALPGGASRKVFIGRDSRGEIVVRPGGINAEVSR